MGCNVYLVRHGETYWNALNKMQGQVNIPLNKLGYQQAKKAAIQIENIPIDLCYSSPLSRAFETAKVILNNRNVEIIKSELLLEQSYGLSEGALQDIGFSDPASKIYNYVHAPEKYVPDIGGESFSDIMHRGQRIIQEILLPASNQYRNILVSAHGAIICGILNTILHKPIEDFWQTKLENCGIAVLHIEKGILCIK